MNKKWYLTTSQAKMLEQLSTDNDSKTVLATIGLEIEILQDFKYDKLPDRKLIQVSRNRAERRNKGKKFTK